ncbi:MAG: prealbumin-like fold domain-containing protein [Saprospiraceae bacterium]|nr:prealbumin-like fold domain-containing protein [Saprospiraceae bacterium]
MKIKKFLLIVLVILSCLSCSKKDDDNPEPTNTTTQGLILKVQDNSNSPVGGATIGICYTISEALSNTFIESKVSDSSGKAVFTSLAKGDYYYKVTSSFGEKTTLFTYSGGNQTIIVQVN